MIGYLVNFNFGSESLQGKIVDKYLGLTIVDSFYPVEGGKTVKIKKQIAVDHYLIICEEKLYRIPCDKVIKIITQI